MDTIPNVYDDPARAAAYATLEYPGTYWLAFRDLPALIAKHIGGTRALDFGCGAGRSTRFLEGLGFDAVGVDVSESMLALARERDPGGRYERVPEGWPGVVGEVRAGIDPVDLVLCAYPFDNIPGTERRREILAGLRRLLRPGGRIVILASAPELYRHEWLSFTTAAFPENRRAGSGETVRIVMKDVPDARPVLDLLWTDDDYRSLFDAAGLALLETARPLGRAEEPHAWVSETTVAPWAIYITAERPGQAGRL